MVEISEVETPHQLLRAIFLRRQVLVGEKGYSSYEDEPDTDDLASRIYIAKEGMAVVGTVRVRQDAVQYRIQRMAISSSFRGRGIGKKLMERVLDDYHGKPIYLMSPEDSIPFYEQFGFKDSGITEQGKVHLYHRLQNY